MPNEYTFHMEMTCGGCANAAKKVLTRLGDVVSSVETDVEAKTVKVKTSLSSDLILEALKKTGKECRFLK